MAFSFEGFVEDVISAAKQEYPDKAVRTYLEECVSDPDPIIAVTPSEGDNEILLHEDEALSIWWCKFDPHVLMPPHEHKLTVHIAAYKGGEKNILFKRENGMLTHDKTHVVEAGEVFTMYDDELHAVTGNGNEPSYSLHVYMGPLTTLQRDLFDWKTGDPVEFSMENFNNMKRASSELPAY
ncbi:MAG: hypothetical protein AAF478_13180 [Pseudomonadota bacterium]